jgi:hypothetical protein
MEYVLKYNLSKNELIGYFHKACGKLNIPITLSNNDNLNFQTPDTLQKGLDVQIYFQEDSETTTIYFNFSWKKTFGITPIIQIPEKSKLKIFEKFKSLFDAYANVTNELDENILEQTIIEQNKKQSKVNQSSILISALIILIIFGSFSVIFYKNSIKSGNRKSVPKYNTESIDGTYINEVSINNGNMHGKVPIVVKVAGNHYTLAMYNDLLPNSWQEFSGKIDDKNNLYIGNGLATPPIGVINNSAKTITIYSLTAPINIKLNNLILSKSN